jgi:PhnB protein
MPFVTADDAALGIAFYKEAFGAIEIQHLQYDGGKIARCVPKVGESEFSVHDYSGEQRTPGQLGGSPIGFMISIEDVDAVFAKAVEAGASVRDEPADQFHGARQANVVDPSGILWSLIGRNPLPRAEVAERWSASSSPF